MQRQIEAANRGVEGGRGRKKTLGAEGPQGLSEPTGRTRDVLALESGTSTKRIRQALTVQKLAAQGRVAPELAEQLTDGTVKLHEVINRAAPAPAPAPAKDGSISADQSIAIEAQKATWEAAEWVRLRRLDALDRIHTGQIPQPKPNVINRIMKTAGASKRKAQQAITVQKADPELLKQVAAGTISLNDAAMQVTQKPSKRQQIRDAAAKRRMVGALSQIRGACRGLSGLNASAVRRDCSDEETSTWAATARNAAKELRLFSSKLESTEKENQ
jgi:hypothetical protein